MDTYERLAFLIKGTAYLLDDSEQRVLAPFDLSNPRYHLLTHISEQPGITPSVLSQKMLCHRSNVTRLVRSLEKEGLLERRHNEVDYRSVHLVLTAEGESRLQQAQAAYQKHAQKRIRQLSVEDRQQLLGNLQMLFRLLGKELDLPIDMV